jgi:hypothetical protein
LHGFFFAKMIKIISAPPPGTQQLIFDGDILFAE